MSRPSSFATNRISKDQVEKLNNLIGALICHGKDHLDYDYVEDDLIEYFIEAFLYSIDSNYRSYIEVKPLYKCEGKTPDGPMLYVKTENEYKSDFEVKIDKRREGDPAILIADSSKINETLGWTPKYDLQVIVESAWKWHEKINRI